MISMTAEKYQIKTDVYEGPFDLLLDLINKHKVNIHDLSLSQITRDYLIYLKKIKELNLEVASGFLLVAATLLAIKSANLFSEEREELAGGEIGYPETREELIARLIEYKKFKNISMELAARLEVEDKFYPRDVQLEEQFSKLLPDFLAGVSLEELPRIFTRLMRRYEVSLFDSTHIIPAPLSVEEKMEWVIKRLKKIEKQTFRQLTDSCRSRIEVITIFLALLELFKQSKVKLKQAETFGEIEIGLAGGSLEVG